MVRKNSTRRVADGKSNTLLFLNNTKVGFSTATRGCAGAF
jgi:hypothetical protein